jgi:hypothetical protein
MRGVGIVAGCVGLAMLVSGCDPNDRAYFRGGIGTELYTVDSATVAELQNLYLDYLCKQSRPFVGAGAPGCAEERIPADAWPLIVQAGMNDIDLRCDAYLSWLDQKKRETAGVLTEIAAVRVAVDAVTNPAIATGISPIGLAAIAAAFGLATSTFNNINSLLLQVDHTTVQSVVFINRRNFRESLLDLPINNKPMAVHALRTYLTICMPMTISANINATVTVFKQAGPGALNDQPFGGGTSTIARPVRSTDNVGQKTERKFEVVTTFNSFIKGYDEKKFPKDVVATMLNVLCVPSSEVTKITTVVGSSVKPLINIFEETDVLPEDNAKISRDGLLDTSERDLLIRENNCPSGIRNFYERVAFKDGAVTDISDTIKLLNKEKVTGLADLPLTTTLAGARDRIAKVRSSLVAKKAKVKAGLGDQWTRDLFETLSLLKTTPAQ